jgi:Uncharacterised protein family (UPF0259)
MKPLNMGAVIDRVFAIYVDQAPVLMPAAAVVFVFTGILSEVLVRSSSGLGVVAILITLIASTLFTGMVVELVADVQDGRRDASVGRLLSGATPVVGKLILLGIVEAIGFAIGFVLLVVPCLILLTIWSVAAPAVVLERAGVFAALGRSRELVRGNGWQVFGVVFLLLVGVIVVSVIVETAAAAAGTGAGIVARVVVGVLTAPLSALAAGVLYFQLGGRGATELSSDDAPPSIA